MPYADGKTIVRLWAGAHPLAERIGAAEAGVPERIGKPSAIIASSSCDEAENHAAGCRESLIVSSRRRAVLPLSPDIPRAA